MTERLETIKVIDTAQEAAMKMAKKNVSSFAVVHEDGRAAGIVTERDFVRGICAADKISSKVKVQEIISSPVKTINTDTSIGEAADIMVRNKIRHLLVTDKEDKKPTGNSGAFTIAARLLTSVDRFFIVLNYSKAVSQCPSLCLITPCTRFIKGFYWLMI